MVSQPILRRPDFHFQNFPFLISQSGLLVSSSSPLSTLHNDPQVLRPTPRSPSHLLAFWKGQGDWKMEGYDPSPLHTSPPDGGPSARQDPLPRVPEVHCPPRLCRLVLGQATLLNAPASFCSLHTPFPLSWCAPPPPATFLCRN